MVSLQPEESKKSCPAFFPAGAWLVFLLALTLRLVFALQWQDMPYGDTPLLDAKAYDDWALTGHGGEGVYYQSPLYPALLARLYDVAGHSYLAVSCLNAVLDSGTAVLLGLIAQGLFGGVAAWGAGLLAALYAPMIFYTAPPMKESLILFLLATYLWAGLRWLRGRHLRDAALCGLAAGLAVLARGNVLLLLPLFPFLVWRASGARAWRGCVLYALLALGALVPTAWHNDQTAQDVVPITYADGFNLYIGHSPYANGTNAYPPEISTDPEQEKIQTTLVAQQETGRLLKPSEVSAFWRAKAVDFAWHHPEREIELLGLKCLAFWNASDRYDTYDVGFIKQNFPSLLNLPLGGFALIAALAAFAAAGIGRRAFFLSGGALLYMVSVVIFYVTDRYRLPVVVFLLPLAGAAVPCALTLIGQRRPRRLAVAGLAGGAFLLLALLPPLDGVDLSAFDWGTLVAVYADHNDARHTAEAFDKGIALSPVDIGSQAYIRMAESDEKQGQGVKADELITRARQFFPQDGIVLYNLGRRAALRGDRAQAVTLMQQARLLTPAYSLTYFALAKLYDQAGDKAQAQAALREGLAINPFDARLLALATEYNIK